MQGDKNAGLTVRPGWENTGEGRYDAAGAADAGGACGLAGEGGAGGGRAGSGNTPSSRAHAGDGYGGVKGARWRSVVVPTATGESLQCTDAKGYALLSCRTMSKPSSVSTARYKNQWSCSRWQVPKPKPRVQSPKSYKREANKTRYRATRTYFPPHLSKKFKAHKQLRGAQPVKTQGQQSGRHSAGVTAAAAPVGSCRWWT